MEAMARERRATHTALVTGGARRVGRALAEEVARAGADAVIHHGASAEEAEQVAGDVRALGRRAAAVQADLADPGQTSTLVARAEAELGPIDWLVNSAAIFEAQDIASTTVEAWDRDVAINLRVPFLPWRALRPTPVYFPYTIAKAGLAAMTRSLAVGLAPTLRVNGLPLGAILPPADGGDPAPDVVPAGRWAKLEELGQALLFLLDGPDYITGSILHLDGGRHLV